MDWCSLEGRTLKQSVVLRHLSHFVLVRLKPVANAQHRRFAHGFGVEVFPSALLLDWKGEERLGWVGDVSEEEVAAELWRVRTALERD